MDRARPDVFSWILVACAITATVVLVRREFVNGNGHPATEMRRPVYVESWREVLKVGIRLGPEAAPVQLVEFADFECPACAQFEATASGIRARYPDQVSLVFAHSPLSFHKFAEPAARAAECADRQGRFDPMRTALFERQKSFGLIAWSEYAKQAGIANMEAFETCMQETHVLPRVQSGRRLAQEFGAQGTPTVLINGWLLPLPPSLDELDQYVSRIVSGREPVEERPSRFWDSIWPWRSKQGESG